MDAGVQNGAATSVEPLARAPCFFLPTGNRKQIKMFGSAFGRFMYFAFGSNLLKERLQLANPSAIFCTTGRLKVYHQFVGKEKNTPFMMQFV